MNTILEVKNLSKKYGKSSVLNGIDFSIKPGEIFAIIGPNGAGKSTTLKIVSTIISQYEGEVFIYGENIKENPNKTRSNISYLPEESGAYKNMTGLDYLRFMAAIYEDDKKKQIDAVNYGATIANLDEKINHKIKEYSKGMTRKLLLAKTIMSNPKLAILDEPTSGLDVINAVSIRDTIKKMAEKGMSVLLSSHNMLEIEHISDRVAILYKGKIQTMGTPEQIKKDFNCKNLEEVFVNITKNSNL